jgi:hypothetical protein
VFAKKRCGNKVAGGRQERSDGRRGPKDLSCFYKRKDEVIAAMN